MELISKFTYHSINEKTYLESTKLSIKDTSSTIKVIIIINIDIHA